MSKKSLTERLREAALAVTVDWNVNYHPQSTALSVIELEELLLEAAGVIELMNETIISMDELLQENKWPGPCEVEIYSWDYYRPEQVDPYWMRCDKNEGHEGKHENSDTGAKWE